MTSVPAHPPTPAAPPRGGVAGKWAKYNVAALFLLPAAVFLAVWMIYPTIKTVYRSFFSDRDASQFVWFDNYKNLFSEETILTAIKNNAIWVAIVPAAVTLIGLIFAVLTERVRWSVAFKFVVFMPLAISLFAVGVIWRIMYDEDPERGALNAAIGAARGVVTESGVLPEARASSPALTGSPTKGFRLKNPIKPGEVALLGLTAIAPDEMPKNAKQAAKPEPNDGAITGVVWRDFKPGGGKPGEVEQEELAIPGATVDLLDANGKEVASTKAGADGTFTFNGVKSGSYGVAVDSKTFAAPFGGVNWLGPKLITPAIIIAYLWAAAGFAMVVIAAGLAAIPRDTLEAARTDGASEWQVFRRVIVPLLAPVLTVVFVTQIIGVLKVFDLVLAVAPGSSRDDATVIAFEMWLKSFSGQNRFGLGAAISTFLFLLFIPFLVLNIRRFRAESR